MIAPLCPIHQYTNTQLSSWIASALAVCIEFATHDGFGQIIDNWTCWVFNPRVHTGRHNSTRLNMFSFQFFYQIRWHSSRAGCESNTTHRATPKRLSSTVESRRNTRNWIAKSAFDAKRYWISSVICRWQCRVSKVGSLQNYPSKANIVGHGYNCRIPVLEILQETKKRSKMFKFQNIVIILYHYVHNNILR